MKRLFTHENRLLVINVKNQLENAGIGCFLKNEFAAGAAGDLSPLDTWAEVWIINDSDWLGAQALLEQAAQPDAEAWLCPACGEQNEGSFEICWQCQTERS